MRRLMFACVALTLSSTALVAQQSAQEPAQQGDQSGAYTGTSTPPPDDTITIPVPQPKPPAAHPVPAPDPADVQSDRTSPQPTSVDPAANYPTATDGDMVQGAPAPLPPAAQPSLAPRAYAEPADPDGDMVHPVYRADELGEGTTIRVKLLDRLSTADSEKGQPFRCRVATDVLQNGLVLIPAGAEIDGQVVQVSSGDHLGAHGSMHIRPESLILADGSRYRIHADITGAPGSHARVGGEGAIRPGSRVGRDSIEYGGAVGAGAVTGAVLGGPVGALTGGLVGAGVVTTHLLVSHPQATLEPGTTLLFTLTEPLRLTPASFSGN